MLDLPITSGTGGDTPLSAHRGIMADLLRRIAERADPAAFRELYEAYGPRVKAYMMRQGADAGTAEDLARNLRIDRLRREVPWQELPEGRLTEASSEPLPDDAMAEKERQERVQAALAELPLEQKDVVTLAYLEGLSHSEIAERLGLPLGTVKSRMRIAYQKIRQGLESLE
jgi:RNA polymerase sigma-70 factor, ECF subfamily